MSELYDSGLFDSDDMAKAYNDGFTTARQTLTITVTAVCPICMEPLVATKHPIGRLPLFVHDELRWCIKCETEVPVMVRITT